MSTELIMGLGSDQISNQFSLLFPGGIPGGGDKDLVALRMDQSFDIPERTLGTYDIMYRGLKITKTSTLDDTDKNITCEIRLDQQWEVFDALNNWIKMVFDPETHIAYEDADVRTTAIVQAFGRNGEIVKTIIFKGVVIKSLKIGTFDPASGDPVRLSVGFTYFNYIIE